MASPALATTTGIGGLTGGGFDYLGQYNATAGFTTGKYRPAQTLVAAVTGGLAAPYAVSYGFWENVAIGGIVGGTNAIATNQVYKNDSTYISKDWLEDGIVGGIGAGLGFKSGSFIENSISNKLIYNSMFSYTVKQMKTFSSYTGNVVNTGVSGVTPIVYEATKK